MRKLWPILTVLTTVALSIVGVPTRAQAPDNTPIKPEIPLADRNNPDRVFLEHADVLKSTYNTDYQILVGNVEFRRDGMFMYCDSAHFYDKTGSFDAFGNVRMEQGDTLFVYADTLNYDDPQRRAILIASPTKKVRLINRDVTLTTDEFNYDLEADLGYYTVGGVLTDRQNRLTSIEGEYSPTTKEAVFRQNVHLTSLSENDTLEIFTDNLYYSTLTHVAEMTTPSRVISGDGVILTTNGIYNTETTQTELFDRSTVESRNGNTLTGDTLYYNRRTGRGEAFGNMEINDTTNHVILQGNYGYYDELIDSAFVTGRARAIEYSTADSLFLHGDTIRTFRIIGTKTVSIPIDETPTDTIVAQADTTVAPTDFTAAPTDSIIASTDPIIASGDNIIASSDSPVINNDTLEINSDTLPEVTPLPEVTRVSSIEVPDTVHYMIAAPRVKFYRRDLQGLCDSMTFVSSDTMLYMDRSPIVWSEDRQISGDAIQLHLNDSTVDWAHIPRNGFMAEMIEEGYFNQLSGKEMHARFVDRALHRLDVSGNVLAISFPEESDSTINKVMNIESSFLVAFFKDNAIDSMKLWSDTNGSATPLYLAKKSLFFLPSFKWYDSFRPTSPDDIFNFPPELTYMLDNAPVYVETDRTAPAALRKSPAAADASPRPADSHDSGITDGDAIIIENNDENKDSDDEPDEEQSVDRQPADRRSDDISRQQSM